mmetsp:Transcript_5368/g.8292  ORF Transcript_5368/g.8292 Transcript_5368/m.8292 type:complete len:118 (-) Transcript_5368:657-1010(-)
MEVEFPAVDCVGHNYRFYNHALEEDTDKCSKVNTAEARAVVNFACDLILKGGYKQSQITILSCYKGQVKEMRKLREFNKETTDVDVQTVDNFQGEENDIIILSLVRSNKRGDIGFLK